MSENHLKVERIASVEGFKELREEWNQLLSQSESNTLMLRWEWLFTWWEVFKDDTTELLILAVRDGQRGLVGVAPFYLRHIRPGKFMPTVRRLMFLGTGEEEKSEVCSEYLDIISLPGNETEILDSALSYVCDGRHLNWDEVFLQNVLEGGGGLAPLCGLAGERGVICESDFSRPCYYVELPKKWEDVLAGMTQKQRYEVRRDTKRFYELGRVEFALYEENDCNEWLEIIQGLHQERWEAAGHAGVFSSEKFLCFHRRILEIACRNRWLQLPALFLDGKPVGAFYNFVYGGKIYEYQTGIKRDVGKGISVGNVLHALVIQDAVARGLREYDFLGGDYDYKRRWATGARKMGGIRVYSRGLKTDVLRRLSSLKNKVLER